MSIIDRYKIGGLEPNDDKPINTLTIDNTKYITDRFKAALRNTVIDWGTFLEIYEENDDICVMFDQAVKLFDLKDNKYLRKDILLTLKSVYELPDEAHLACMLKQYLTHETMSIVIYNIFIQLKLHYEKVVIKFLELRNKTNPKKPNNIEQLMQTWSDMDKQYDLNSSSIVLLFLNPKLQKSNVGFGNSKIIYKIKGVNTKSLEKNIKKFHYKGFCRKVPSERLIALLEFPIYDFMTVIHNIEEKLHIDKTDFPDYSLLEKKMQAYLNDKIKKPEMPSSTNREYPDMESTTIHKAKFYIDKILEIRKKLLSYGIKYEEYYTMLATKLVDVYELLKTSL